MDTTTWNFRSKIREYNSALVFTSVKYKPDNRPEGQGSGIRCFQIHGELYHLQGPLQPPHDGISAFAQLYFYDPAYAAQASYTSHPRLDHNFLQNLTIMLHEVYPYIAIYKTAKEIAKEGLDAISSSQSEVKVVLNPQLRLVMETSTDRQRENLPRSDEIAVIIPDEYGEAGFCDIVLAKRNGNQNDNFSIINPNHASYMPLHYVLLFPHGDLGWYWD